MRGVLGVYQGSCRGVSEENEGCMRGALRPHHAAAAGGLVQYRELVRLGQRRLDGRQVEGHHLGPARKS